MIFAGIDVNIITHEKALLAGVEAMGLWMWGMCYAQTHGTDGRLPRVAVLAAFMGKRNIMLAGRLVASGLWVANEDGSWSIWNYEKKNQSAQEIAQRRAARELANAERQKRWRNARRNATVTDPVTRNDLSNVTHRNGPTTTTPLPLQDHYQTKPDLPSGDLPRARDGVVRLDLEITSDVQTVWDQRTFTKPAGKPIEDVWANFLGHYASQDFQTREALIGRWSKWVDRQCDMHTKERVEAAARREREAKWDKQRAGPAPPCEAQKLTQAEQEELARRVPMRRRSSGEAA
jgi:hypothetical protein